VSFSLDTILSVVMQMASALDSVHLNNVSHGDIYAHNIMINESAQVLFGDFGAATCYSLLAEKSKKGLMTIELRALGNLLEDMLTCISINSTKAHPKRYKGVLELKALCIGAGHVSYDSFSKIANQISHICTLD
jgi:serine/threonine protein kinase